MATFDLILKGATAILPDKTSKKDIAIKDGKISAIDDNLVDAQEVIDCCGKHILPGVIDSQVHFREPGLEHKEDLETGSKAAAMGGVTTFFEMPNTTPATTSVESIRDKLRRAGEKSFTNFAFYIGATGENLDQLLKAVKLPGCCGIKIFLGSSTGSLLLYDRQKLLEIFKATDAPIAVHSENEIMLNQRISIRDNASSAHAHPEWRNAETALTSTQMIIDIAKEAGRKVHILHVTTKDEVEFLASQKDFCTIECTPQHLTLAAPECYDKLGAYAQMNPPIRSAEHREALWKALELGIVDVIGSDHAPHTRQEKDQGYPKSPSGMPGVQTLLPLMLNHVNEGKLTLERLVQMVCSTPARLWSMPTKGRLEVGMDADITIVDMNREHTITNQEQASRCGWTPFDGMKIKGLPTQTIVGGVVVMNEGEIIGRGKVGPAT